MTASAQFSSWLNDHGLSLAMTTYQVGKLFFIGTSTATDLSVFERSFARCMGMCATDNGLYLSSLYQIWRFENILGKGERYNGYDRLYVPQVGYTTGDLDVHDVAIGSDERPIFVNTRFGCLATLSDKRSFKPIWRPYFVSELVAEDRCHLNGLAMREGKPAFATAIAQTDILDGWRQHRVGGGVVIDVEHNEVILSGLSMPHSPRWHQGKLWLLNSGTGEFGFIDPSSGRFEQVCFCEGYMRGLAFYGNYAVIGLSKPREQGAFSELPLSENLRSRGTEAKCGVCIIDLQTGILVHWIKFSGLVKELYDVVVLPSVKRPMALGFQSDEIKTIISI